MSKTLDIPEIISPKTSNRKNNIKDVKKKETVRVLTPEVVKNFLSTPKTLAQVGAFVKSPITPSFVHTLPLPENYAFFEQRDSKQDILFSAIEKRERPPNRNWDLWTPPKHDPYIWVQFPRTMKQDKLRIVPLSDVHYGARAHNNKRFVEYLKWIENNDEAFTFLNGDLIENAIDGSIGGAVYESSLTPEEQIWGTKDGSAPGIIELLRPIAHKILWAQPGNHEWRTWKKANIDPLKIICHTLKIPYFSEPIYADVLAWGHKFTFYCHHGTTSSMTKGGKLNAAMRPAEFQEAVDYIIMGHVHDSAVNSTTRLVRQRVFDSSGHVVSFSLQERPQYVVICPSFYGYFNSYGSRAGYSPGSWGSVSCTLFADGTYRTSE